MRVAVYGAVLVIALCSVLLSFDRLSAPMSPMVDTAAGLRAAVPSSPAVQAAPSVPRATIGAPIVPPALAAPASPTVPTNAMPQAAAPVAAPEPQPRCNINACTAAYRSFRPSDCTYQPNDGPRRLCTK